MVKQKSLHGRRLVALAHTEMSFEHMIWCLMEIQTRTGTGICHGKRARNMKIILLQAELHKTIYFFTIFCQRLIRKPWTKIISKHLIFEIAGKIWVHPKRKSFQNNIYKPAAWSSKPRSNIRLLTLKIIVRRNFWNQKRLDREHSNFSSVFSNIWQKVVKRKNELFLQLGLQ